MKSNNPLSDDKIVSSWKSNVQPWISAIRDDEIISRVLVTNQAILDIITGCSPEKLLDVGCGEGWLVRELVEQGIDALGIDAVPEFIEYASNKGKGRFKVLSYEGLSADVLQEKFDIVVCNFSLLGEDSVNHVFQQVSSLLVEGGVFVVQTIHPIAGCATGKYEDGWREGSWGGFSERFRDPAPWYFRTLETWGALYLENGLILNEMIEPLNPKSGGLASVIFVGEVGIGKSEKSI